MTFAAKIDGQGRVLIPQEIRDSLDLQEDSQVELELIRQPLPPTPFPEAD